jgi:hypothetical protein
MQFGGTAAGRDLGDVAEEVPDLLERRRYLELILDQHRDSFFA